LEAQTLTVHITVNSRPKEVPAGLITFDQLVELGFGHPPEGGTVYYTIAYRRGHTGGSLTEGESVTVEEGMRFDVKRTDRS
jgi:hypothetical protein